MQFTQPGFFNYGPQPTFNTPFQFNGYPEVIGEGNVTSVMSPDGSMQLLFLPTSQWWRPYPCNINAGNVNSTNWNPTGAWFIRTVFSPIQPMPYQLQPFQCPSNVELPRNCCESVPSYRQPSFELKFHNDISTSTSDIHYFYPTLRSDWLRMPNNSPSVQIAAVPMTTNDYSNEVTCSKPCKCVHMDTTMAEKTAKSICTQIEMRQDFDVSGEPKTSQSSLSDMACDADKPEIQDCHKDKEKKSRKEKKMIKLKSKKHKVICECSEYYIDKSVSTYADQACGCVAEKGRETQTAPGQLEAQTDCGKGCITHTGCETMSRSKISKKDLKTELWIPKTVMKTKSSVSFANTSGSGCCSGCSETTACQSDTD